MYVTKDGATREKVEEMFTDLQVAGNLNLLQIGQLIASLAFGDRRPDDQEWVFRRYREMYDRLQETPLYKEITRLATEKALQEGHQEGLREGELRAVRGLLLSIVQARFPKLSYLAKRLVSTIADSSTLQNLFLKISMAANLEEARQYLRESSKENSMESELRAATQEDYEAVCVLLAEVDRIHAEALPELFRPVEGPARSREWFAGILADEHAALFVAEQQGTLLGLIRCLVRTTPSLPMIVPRRFVQIEDLVVGESFRHQGVGQSLLERAAQWACEQGIAEVELGVWEFNTSARALYEHLGYRTTRRVMRKRLL
ncbi:MAG TPA: GNAT family N-acetyltransferase [Ktedonobacteraceae bacterium]|nr:GNAT family N-acetyltransferase [Ktedonobacteraceae bacterium]